MSFVTEADRVTPQELHELLAEDGDIELLDVRTPGEHAVAHVPGARLLPLADLSTPRPF